MDVKTVGREAKRAADGARDRPRLVGGSGSSASAMYWPVALLPGVGCDFAPVTPMSSVMSVTWFSFAQDVHEAAAPL